MNQFKKINKLTGWVIFAIATLVYWVTVEETASFWDCGEFIAVSYKLMVPHPPGAPFFLLIGRLFSFLALGDVERVAYWINIQSVLSSSFTILFLFWTIVLLGRKIIQPVNGTYSLAQTIQLMGAGAVGALAYTFSDSFWFSAVEAEVYAMSSFFTAFVFWAILKWEHIKDERAANRWLILIAYMMGLSIGVHLLNLVTIPALALIYYFKKNENPTPKGIILTLGAGLLIVGIINSGIIPGLPSIAGSFEIFFVNSLGLPFRSGIIFFSVIFLSAVIYGIYYTQKHQKLIYNTVLLCLAFILVGYSSYMLIIIRSNFDPPIDENNPENVISFVSYLKREQYGNRPLLYGPTYEAQRSSVTQGEPLYRKGEDKYEIYDYRTEVEYSKKDKILLPRIYSNQGGHPDLYREWIGLREGEKPTMGDNLFYLLRYQFGHMYFRYFMWNFAGREGDDKDAGFLMPWDSKSDVSSEIANSKAWSNFYCIPLIIGILGMFFQYVRNEKTFWVTMLLFFLTGLALVLYLNSPPVEPRERDYIYVGSYYVFAIWIGFGVFFLSDTFNKILKNAKLAGIIATVIGLMAPGIMAANGWDNHNRSNRWHSIDQAKNTLRSCAENAILFTGGDNDTFPLWYVQNVEGFRTDVRVVVLSYFSTDWYIDQMRHQTYESEPLPIKMNPNNYLAGTNDYLLLVEDPRVKGAVNVKTYVNYIDNKHPDVLERYADGSVNAKLISKNFYLDVDKENVLKQGFIPKDKEDRLVDRMIWTLKPGQRAIMKNELALLDILSHNNWERPIYFNNTSANTIAMDLRPYLQLEGMAYRLMPVRAKQESGEVGEVNIEVMKQNISEFEFRGFDDPNTYNDEEYKKFGANTRNSFYRLANALYLEGRDQEALLTLDSALIKIPDATIPYSYFMPRYIDLYHRLGNHHKASEIAEIISKRSEENLEYLINTDRRNGMLSMIQQKSFLVLNQLALLYRDLSEESSAKVKALNEQISVNQEDASLETQLKKAQEEETMYLELAQKYNEVFIKYARVLR
ncbi:DUF2723 domain-containing protein [Rapidithrix thailandica]|uniref:DUF2723 domain-containing protein n=1 Tax=Rapidithrix thailandica TaxID=413964 RepID=A0AAW9SB70_9BACT